MAEQTTGVARNERPRAEIEAPRFGRCSHCGHEPQSRTEDHRVVYTTRYPESGVRRVTAQCQRCGGIVWWDERI